jgi:hypothetical protein
LPAGVGLARTWTVNSRAQETLNTTQAGTLDYGRLHHGTLPL